MVFSASILILLAVSCNAQQLIELKSFKGGNVTTKIDATGPYSVYVSASSDPIETLKQVYLTTSDNQNKSLYELKNSKLYQNSGLLLPFVVNSEAFLTTQISNEQMNTLKGFLYVTTAQQLANTDGFFVYDVTVSEKIQVGTMQSDNCTLVFLNTVIDSKPWPAATISFWTQTEDSSVSIYEGIPKDTAEKNASQIFSNPVLTTWGHLNMAPSHDYLFIPHVERFSLNLPAFYFKTFKGVQFVIEPSDLNINGSHTNAMTTTGLYMKPFNAVDTKVTVTTVSDSRYNGTTGANVVGSVSEKAVVNLIENDNDQFSAVGVTPSDQIQGWSVNVIGQNFSISSVGATAGEFFVQYYVIQGNRVVATTPSNQPETTTKSAAALQFFTSCLIAAFGSRFL